MESSDNITDNTTSIPASTLSTSTPADPPASIPASTDSTSTPAAPPSSTPASTEVFSTPASTEVFSTPASTKFSTPASTEYSTPVAAPPSSTPVAPPSSTPDSTEFSTPVVPSSFPLSTPTPPSTHAPSTPDPTLPHTTPDPTLPHTTPDTPKSTTSSHSSSSSSSSSSSTSSSSTSSRSSSPTTPPFTPSHSPIPTFLAPSPPTSSPPTQSSHTPSPPTPSSPTQIPPSPKSSTQIPPSPKSSTQSPPTQSPPTQSPPSPKSSTPSFPTPSFPTPSFPTPKSPTQKTPSSPTSPTPQSPTPQSPGVAATPPSTPSSSSNSHPPLAPTLSFKSTLQVLLKKQDNELEKSREYKEREEEEEEEEEEKEEGMMSSSKKNAEDDPKQRKEKEEEVEEKKTTVKDEGKGEGDKTSGVKNDVDNEKKEKVRMREEMEKKINVLNKGSVGKVEGSATKIHKTSPKKIREEEENKNKRKEETKEKEKGDQKKWSSRKKGEEENVEVDKAETRKHREGKEKPENKTRKTDKRGGGGEEEKTPDISKEREKNREREKEDGRKESVHKSGEKGKKKTSSERRNEEETKISTTKRGRTEGDEEGVKEEKAQGILYIKKGERPFVWWKRYFFVLDGKLLMYYRPEQDSQSLSVVKGSLDLAMMEQVTVKRPGIMRSNFPFKLTRRNLPSVSLAAETKEERTRWMDVIGELLNRLQHLTDHSSDPTRRTPHPANTPSDKKYSTLPNPKKSISSAGSSSSSEDEVDLKGIEEEKEEKLKEEEDEDPGLIKPKKILRVPIGMPMAKVNLESIKLRNVQESTKRKEVDENRDQTANDKDEDTGIEKNKTPEELFGVKLKKTIKDKARWNDGDRKLADGEDRKEEAGEETKEQRGESIPKRPTKQPVIPLNTTGLLARPDIQTTKVTPASPKRSTTDRKKSPSPTIPISRSVQALTKSAEEVLPKNKDSLSDAMSTDNISASPKLKGKLNTTAEVTETQDIKYCDVVKLDDNQEMVAPLDKEDKGEKHDKENIEEKEVTTDKNVLLPIPSVSITLKSDSEDDHESEEINNKEEELDTALRTFGNYATVLSRNAESEITPFPSQSSSNMENNKSSSHMSPDSPDLTTSKKIASTICITKVESHSQDNVTMEQNTKIITNTSGDKNEGSTPTGEQEIPLNSDYSPIRERTCTNDSGGSSQHGDCDGTEKKSGKFKLFKVKRSSSSAGKEKKEDVDGKEPKERKRRGSNTFAKLLQGKKSKEKIGKVSDGEAEVQSKETQEETTKPKSGNHSKTSEIPAIEVTIPMKTAVSEEGSDGAKEIKDQNQFDKKRRSENRSQASSITSIENMVIIRRERSVSQEALRESNYSCGSTSSREQEPAPSLPEKTRIRAISPKHDIPQSNRPVTNLYDAQDKENAEVEVRQPVDGIISEQKIFDILSASDRQKRRKSQEQLQGPMLIVPDGSMKTGHEDTMTSRPSYVSLTSTESDGEPLPLTSFLGGERNSSSSGSLKARESDSSSCDEPESSPSVITVPLRKHLRPTDSLTAGKRVSLTNPEFTVLEEDGTSSPDTSKSRLPTESKEKEKKDTQEESTKEKAIDDKETDERGDYFPVIGRGVGEGDGEEVKLRLSLNTDTNPMRTSGIMGLQQYLREEEGEEPGEVRSGISRLGHSAAIEKLKQTTGEV
ncbi:hypothetical protein Pcinc_038917 [Petrolisthes cinctipes]|uniref:PH domain-containing protein n=1 Tax=Petrolisthes cinctipes TaxID=88211 RepID=A0AAE1BQG3_PETCI|nr:hypothetical protein Pcinc_038917 [Petrolisthes cinctipes]